MLNFSHKNLLGNNYFTADKSNHRLWPWWIKLTTQCLSTLDLVRGCSGFASFSSVRYRNALLRYWI